MYRKPLKLDDEPLKFEVMFRLAPILLRDSKWKHPHFTPSCHGKIGLDTVHIRWSLLSRMIPDENFAHCYHLRLPDPLPVEKCQLQSSLATKRRVLGNFS